MSEVETIKVRAKDLPTVKIPLQGFPAGPFDEVLNDTEDLNLHHYLIRKESDTFFARISMTGDSMILAGILPGAIIIYDTGIEAREGDIVVARLGSDLTVKRLKRIKDRLYLVAETTYKLEIEIVPYMDLHIMGVVQHVINSVGRKPLGR